MRYRKLRRYTVLRERIPNVGFIVGSDKPNLPTDVDYVPDEILEDVTTGSGVEVSSNYPLSDYGHKSFWLDSNSGLNIEHHYTIERDSATISLVYSSMETGGGFNYEVFINSVLILSGNLEKLQQDTFTLSKFSGDSNLKFTIKYNVTSHVQNKPIRIILNIT